MTNEIIDHFQHYFPGNKDDIRVFFAPGRVNLIGEHTDYNGGFVFPTALTIGTYMVLRERTDSKFRLVSGNFPNQDVNFSLGELTFDSEDSWGNYPKGVVLKLKEAGLDLRGADVYYSGNIPNGAGLSSSASISMVTALAFSMLSGASIEGEDLAKLCQKVENEFIGVNTGIMDQFAVGMGKEDHALFLNCQTMEYEQVPLHLGNYQLVITNTNKRRGLADSKYNERRSECEKGLELIQQFYPEKQSISELTVEEYRAVSQKIEDDVILRRVRHVVTENERVKLAKKFLAEGHLVLFGDLMKQSHESLRDDYEVTGKELDALFEIQRTIKGCIGTRMTGGGFGGCTVSIVDKEAVEPFKERVKEVYQNETGLEPSFYICESGDGVKELKGAVV